jgi:hypothetical protein
VSIAGAVILASHRRWRLHLLRHAVCTTPGWMIAVSLGMYSSHSSPTVPGSLCLQISAPLDFSKGTRTDSQEPQWALPLAWLGGMSSFHSAATALSIFVSKHQLLQPLTREREQILRNPSGHCRHWRGLVCLPFTQLQQPSASLSPNISPSKL